MTMDTGLLVIRVIVGLLMAAHGAQKLLGWFGGYGLNGTAGFFDALGFRPGKFFAATAATTEIASGLLADALLGIASIWTPALSVAILIVGIAGGLANVALRRPAAQAPAAA
jgi:putative oxidoreductase